MGELAGFTQDDLAPIQDARLLLNVNQCGMKAAEWARENRSDVERLLQENGALLIRGLRFPGSQQFGIVLATLFGEPLIEYTYRSTPRTELRGNVYTATEYHPDLVIPLHNENSYSNRWSLRIGFLCAIPASQGGSTPICDSRSVYRQIPSEVRRRFEKHGVMYVRNYSEIDIPWTEVFQTSSREDVEKYCNDNRISFEWLADNNLRTQQINQASAVHPTTGEPVWFNQAHLFHVSSLEPEFRRSLMTGRTENELPRNACYGDGAPIEAETLQVIRDVYERNKIQFKWECNDLLLLDNMLYSHGRDSYSGRRQVLVGMAKMHPSAA